MEKVKYLPPKYSYSMKDLAEYLGIFEVTEDQMKGMQGSDGTLSDTSSSMSLMTQSAFLPKKSQLDVIREQVTYKEEEDEEDGSANKKDGKGGGGRDEGPPSVRENKTVMSIGGARHGGTAK